MSYKSTALAYSNIAYIKYWGRSDNSLRLPLNSSLSMNLSNLQTITTVEFSEDLKSDDVIIDGTKNDKEIDRVVGHLERVRKLANSNLFAKVVSQNNFPSSHGLSSSASGFAALTLASVSALNLKLNEKKLSVLARLGSGSAARSIPGGFVEWYKSNHSEDSFAKSVFSENHWQITDIVVVVSAKKKIHPTSDSMIFALTSPFMGQRLLKIDEKLTNIKKAILEKNFKEFGKIVENEALELHTVIMTQTPSYFYLFPETVILIQTVREWRNNGLEVYFTINTGHDVHLICEQKNKEAVLSKLKQLKFIKKTIINYPAGPAKLINKHLF